MAEFCLKCFNRIHKTRHTDKEVIISKDLDLCEGCGNMKPVVVCFRGTWFKRYFWWLFR